MLPPYTHMLLLNFLYATILHPYGRQIAKGFSSTCLLHSPTERFRSLARLLYRPSGQKLSIYFVLRCFSTSTFRKAYPSAMWLCPYFGSMQELADRMCELLLSLPGRPFFYSTATRTRWLMKGLNFSIRLSPEGLCSANIP